MSDVSFTKITDYVASGRKLLLDQYKNSPKLNLLLGVFLNAVQQLENAVYDEYMLTMLTSAFGKTLDRWGYTYGVERNGLDDNNYRLRILTQIQLNINSGTPNSVITGVTLMLGATKVVYSEIYPKGVLLYVQASGFVSNLRPLIQKLLPVGVCLYPITISTSDNPFVFSTLNFGSYDHYLQIRDSFVTQDVEILNVQDNVEYSLDIISGIDVLDPDGQGFATLILDDLPLQLDDGSILQLSDGSILILDIYDSHEYYVLSDYGGRLSVII